MLVDNDITEGKTMKYSVIIRMDGEIMGSKKGIPCHSLKQAKTLATSYTERGEQFKMTEIVVETDF